jgi:pyruvate/2-oxoglutarate dehydrogenase complex dihydrolipoamide dehydrogenase (E3) component
MLTVDLLVIGFGKGGKTLATTLGQRGWRVALVEQSSQMYGGTCINTGCVPTKSMIYQSERLCSGTEATEAYTAAVNVTQDLTALLRATNLAAFDQIDTASVITGRARFLDATTVQVVTNDETLEVSAKYIVIGTGSRAVIPDIEGLRQCPVAVTNTELLVQQNRPQRLVVLGGGYIGMEFASMFAGYGARVTVLEHNPTVLSREDRDIAELVQKLLGDRDIQIVTGAQISRVDTGRGADGSVAATVGYRVGGEDQTVTADTVLVALGREPVTDELGLDAAGVRTNARGAVVVDEFLRTSQPHIFAVGDVNGGPQFTYISLDDFRIVLDQLTGAAAPRRTNDRTAVPYALFVTPPLGRVGLTERQAREAGRSVKVAALPVAKMATVSRARIVDEVEGMMKVVVDAETDHILGAALLSYDSHEVINTVALAIRHGITASEMRDAIYTHPSMTECFNQLLGALA